jgi:hypothetical protein
MTSNNGTVPSYDHTYMYSEKPAFRPQIGINTLLEAIIMRPDFSKFYTIVLKSGLTSKLATPSSQGRLRLTLFAPTNETLKDVDVDTMSQSSAYTFVVNRLVDNLILLGNMRAKQFSCNAVGMFAPRINVLKGENSIFYNSYPLKQVDLKMSNGVMHTY